MTRPANSTNVALVTGASSGIGRASAEALRKAGFTVVASARRPETLEPLQKSGFHTLQLDVTDEASMQEAVGKLEATYGAVGVLVNNAGYGQNGPVEELPMDAIRRQFETNVFGLVRMCQLVLPGMRRQGGGRIINLSSVGGEFTAPGAGAYHASKYAVEAFNHALRYEVKTFGVDVISVQPGGVRTNFIGTSNNALPQTGDDSPYAFFNKNMADVTERMFSENSSWGILTPERVADVIAQAATVRRPRTRYKVGVTAKLLPLMRRALSDRQWDALWARQFPVQEKRTRVSGNSSLERSVTP